VSLFMAQTFLRFSITLSNRKSNPVGLFPEFFDYFNIAYILHDRFTDFVLIKDSSTIEDLEHDFKKLKLFSQIFYPQIQIDKAEEWREEVLTIKVTPSKKIIIKETENSLMEGLDFIKKDETFLEGFQKIVNWLDSVEGKGQSGLCTLRDVLIHPITDSAYKDVMSNYPEIEFEEIEGGFAFKRNEENKSEIKKLVEPLMERVKKVFTEKRMMD